jgi:hypothetical protein
MPKELAVNEMTKLILTFIAGVVVGVLAATSTMFQGKQEQSPTEIVTNTGRETGGETGQSPGETVKPRVPVEQPATEFEPSELEAQAPQAQAEPNLVQTEPPRSNLEEVEQGAAEDGEALMPEEEQEAEERIFCMLIENSGRCQCYDVETTAPADVSAEECRDRIAEE